MAQQEQSVRQRALDALDIGAAGLAVDLARANPDSFTTLELLRFEHASIAQRLRWAETEMRLLTGPERIETIDQALVEGWDLLNRVPNQPEYDDLRNTVKYDMIYGLSLRGHMQDAIRLFESIDRPWVDIYPYVLVSAANAYAYQERLDPAIDLYNAALQYSGPRDIDRPAVRESLFYAYLDRGRYEGALEQLNQIEKESPPWIEVAPVPEQPNPDFQRYHRLHAQYLLYTGQTDAGMRAMYLLRHDAPYSSPLRNAATDARMGDGRPMEARDAYYVALLERPNDVGAATGLAQASLAVRDYRTAEKIIIPLAERFPEASQVRNLRREWDAYQSPEIEIEAGAGLGDDQAATTAEKEWAVDTRAYSAPFNYNWRVFGHQYTARGYLEDENISRVRNGIGLEYRSTPVEVSAEVHRSTGRVGRYGVSGMLNYYPTDGWRIQFAADTDSNEVPWKAYQQGIHGWHATASVRYQPTRRTYVDLGYTFARYSDSNHRHQVSATLYQHLWARPRHSIAGWLSVSHARNRLQDRPYFSPKKDVTVEATGMYQWNPWRNGRYVFYQRAYLTAGMYDQTGFSAKGLWEVRLEQSWEMPKNRVITYGVGYGRRPYDGAMESRLRVYLSLGIPF